MKKFYYSVIIALALYSSLRAQPSYIYEGGDGGGWSQESDSDFDYYIYQGGASDGVAAGSDFFDHYIYRGGANDGFASSSDFFDHFIYNGGINDGFASGSDFFDHYIYQGGIGDGYAETLYRVPFIWTGAIGTSWTVPGNWNYNLIPGIYRPVIIPDGVPNWPFVNAGLFAIGDNPNGSNYRCATLWIQEDAFLQTRVNCTIENYGMIQIDGEMRVKKITADAFQNFDTGRVQISETGLLNIKP